MRRTVLITIEAEGRDKGKVFSLTEMPAMQAEAWAIRALGVMVRSGQEIPEDAVAAGFATMAIMGVKALLAGSWPEVQPLLDEMMACVEIKPGPDPWTRRLVEEDVEEVATLSRLRDELFTLTAGFSIADMLISAMSAQITQPADPNSSDTQTSPEPSEQ